MLANAPKSQKTSGVLSNFYVDDWEKRGIGIGTLYLVSCNLQRSDQGLTGLKK